MRVQLALAAALAALPLLGGAASADVVWHPANGQSCRDVCGMKKMEPVSTGAWKNSQNLFYVCAANQNGEGWRPGFNLTPSWANVCMVPYGKQEVRASSYSCACQ
ncbi:hypothetical protein [Xanthobacter tagetidis]|jgi:hypothetical protein|uniref:Uncharacterized protein n=1 Tax=Xanthobacter tagetidis TaxID=60216 RepID=A0A3L7A1M3_9HYPH|nr:hypothetical protein [Xanthobacter tagetidis]MBB6309237.1 hypothetical protein [Xanthobacter tagetidis]RLP74196.1 hypothetical protein D9R14_19240 [Xanthobacter tagetidis]